MTGRILNRFVYGYGFNGMERDDEVKGSGNSYTTEFRQYDSRLGRWLSLDPLMAKYPHQIGYAAFNNNPVYFADPTGLEGESSSRSKTDNKKVKEPEFDNKSYRELKRAIRYASEHEGAVLYRYEKKGRQRFGVRVYKETSFIESDGTFVRISILEDDIKFNRISNWWWEKSNTGYIVSSGSGGGSWKDNRARDAHSFEFLKDVDLDLINALISIRKNLATNDFAKDLAQKKFDTDPNSILEKAAEVGLSEKEENAGRTELKKIDSDYVKRSNYYGGSPVLVHKDSIPYYSDKRDFGSKEDSVELQNIHTGKFGKKHSVKDFNKTHTP